jgi:asparagine synthase (glutamine-hydrolysing)
MANPTAQYISEPMQKSMRNRKKNPYPKTYNPSYTQAVVCELNRIISCPSSPLVQLIDVAAVKALLEEVMSSQDSTPWFGQLMTGPQFCAYLIQVDMWLRQYGINVVI